MNGITHPEPFRAYCLDRLRANLRNARVPGGDLAAWVAPLSTGVLAEILLHPRHRTLELLFGARTFVRGIAPGDADADAALARAAHVNVARSYFAETVRLAWMTLATTREALDLGAPEVAQRTLLGLTRWLPDLPVTVARRIEPQVEALWARAERIRERQLADEVA